MSPICGSLERDAVENWGTVRTGGHCPLPASGRGGTVPSHETCAQIEFKLALTLTLHRSSAATLTRSRTARQSPTSFAQNILMSLPNRRFPSRPCARQGRVGISFSSPYLRVALSSRPYAGHMRVRITPAKGNCYHSLTDDTVESKRAAYA